MRQACFTLVGRAVIVASGVLLASGSGCEKVPTFGELTQQQQTTPAAPAAPAAQVQPAAVKPPVAGAQVAPQIENPQKVISDFNNKPSHQRNDQDLARIGNVSGVQDAFTDMDLSGSAVTDEGVKHLAKLTNLKTISFGNTKVTNAGLTSVVELPNLTSINLAACAVTMPMMETLAKMEKLEKLSFESAKVGDNELPPLVNLPMLKELTLNYCPVSDNGFKVLGTLKNLEVLRVAYTSINGSGMQYLKRKRTEPGLRVLDAKKTRFGEQGLQYLRGVETLEELDVGQSEVTDRTLATNLKGVTHLKKLNLAFNVISDKGTQGLAGIKSLEELSLGNCQGVGDQTLFYLKANKELRVLDVNGCANVTIKGVQSLKKLLPDCEIRFAGAKH